MSVARPQRRTITRAFRTRMIRQAGLVFAALIAMLLILAGTLGRSGFFIAALVLIPLAALIFNLMQRCAYAAHIAGKQ
jgi:p-aminobenzoyl-glutamate transporter AbgT